MCVYIYIEREREREREREIGLGLGVRGAEGALRPAGKSSLVEGRASPGSA